MARGGSLLLMRMTLCCHRPPRRASWRTPAGLWTAPRPAMPLASARRRWKRAPHRSPPRSGPSPPPPRWPRESTWPAAGDRHRRRVGHRRGDRACAGRGRGRGHSRRPRPRRGRTASETSGDDRDAAVHVAPLDLADRRRSTRSSRPGTVRCTARQQRRRDGLPRLRPRRAGAPVRHQPPRPLRARPGLHDALAAAGAARDRLGQLRRPPRSPVVFDDIHFERRDVRAGLAYGQSKTANVLFAVEATKRWAGEGITSNALMPGAILTNLQRHVDPGRPSGARARRGARHGEDAGAGRRHVGAGRTSPQLEGVGGRYFEDCNEARLLTGRDDAGLGGVAPFALDPTTPTGCGRSRSARLGPDWRGTRTRWQKRQ